VKYYDEGEVKYHSRGREKVECYYGERKEEEHHNDNCREEEFYDI